MTNIDPTEFDSEVTAYPVKTPHSDIELELAGKITEALEPFMDTNRPNAINAVWAATVAVASWVETHDKALLDDVKQVIQNRVDDLKSCHKDDDCEANAHGAWLALEDVDWHLAGGKEADDSVNSLTDQ